MVSALLSYCDKPEIMEPAIDKAVTFNVAVDYGVPGHFVLSGKRYGYFYEIADAYASAQYSEDAAESSDAYFVGIESALKDGIIDMAVAPASRAKEMKGVYNMPLYTTSYVILARKNSKNGRTEEAALAEIVKDASVTVPLHFTYSDGYVELLSIVPDNMIAVSSNDEFELASDLSGGSYDLLVCEKNEAQLALSFYRNLRMVYEFSDTLSVNVLMSSHRELTEFSEWFDLFKSSDAYSKLNDFYFDKGVIEELRTSKVSRRNIVVGGISVFDNYFIEIGEREGVDWRLLSAIAYEESGFNTDVVSNRGAVGIMQIMPSTAAAFGVDTLLSDLETNITLAAKILNHMDSMLNYDAGTSDDEKLKILLAAYNCGIGRIRNAMKTVHCDGKGCCSWDRVQESLVNMANSEYVSANNIKTGQFRGYKQTLNYVENVFTRYKIYCKALR